MIPPEVTEALDEWGDAIYEDAPRRGARARAALEETIAAAITDAVAKAERERARAGARADEALMASEDMARRALDAEARERALREAAEALVAVIFHDKWEGDSRAVAREMGHSVYRRLFDAAIALRATLASAPKEGT